MKLARMSGLSSVVGVAAAGLCCVGLLRSVAAIPTTRLVADAQMMAQATWRAFMSQNSAREAGCFHTSYPSFEWETVECKVAHSRVRPIPRVTWADAVGQVGDDSGYLARAHGLITETVGTFPNVTGVAAERDVGPDVLAGGAMPKANAYSLQINTNSTGTTAACAGHAGCTVWQQFVYAQDYQVDGEAALFMRYWLVGWGPSHCPTGWARAAQDCYRESAVVTAPDLPITSLAQLMLSATAEAGGNDTVAFNDGTDAYSITAADLVLDISSVWTQSQFNVVGTAGGSRAQFNSGSALTVQVSLTDGSDEAPVCFAGIGSRGETNNLVRGGCSAAGGDVPSIQFTESN
jgi:hypothetical protein